MSDPVSWLLIEPGWKVVGPDGEEIGRVEEVIGDSSHDIWDGLAVATGILARPRYLPAEQVAEITEGQIRLALDKQAVEQLGEWQEPPTTAEVEPEQATAGERAEGWVEAPERDSPRRIPLLRRVLLWLGVKRD
jgi:hypothetical protein